MQTSALIAKDYSFCNTSFDKSLKCLGQDTGRFTHMTNHDILHYRLSFQEKD